jgi:hypothetical protein
LGVPNILAISSDDIPWLMLMTFSPVNDLGSVAHPPAKTTEAHTATNRENRPARSFKRTVDPCAAAV